MKNGSTVGISFPGDVEEALVAASAAVGAARPARANTSSSRAIVDIRLGKRSSETLARRTNSSEPGWFVTLLVVARK